MARLLPLLVALVLGAGSAQAACYADYKAKRDDPLRLHYGVAEVGDNACSVEAATNALRPRLESGGWELLNVLSVFGEEELSQKKDRAGDFFLRF